MSIEFDAPESAERGQIVQSFSRGLSVITAFDADHAVMSTSEISRRTGLTRATAGRFVRTLEELGYLRADGRAYRLTARVLELGFSYLSALSLPEIAQQHLESLSAQVNESSSVSVLDGTQIVYVARVPTRRIMSLHISIGTRFPASTTSMGRVLLAALPSEEAARTLAVQEIEKRTPFTLHLASDLGAELDAVRGQGYSLVDQELEAGLRSIAVPVRHGVDGSVVAAMNVSTTTTRHSVDSIVSELLPPLRDAARRVSADFGAARPFESAQPLGIVRT